MEYGRSMASKAQSAAQNDDGQLDDLFDYDIDTEIPDADAFLKGAGQGNGKPSSTTTRKVNLGVDEEIKIARVKRPTVKLDAERYYSCICPILRYSWELLGFV